MRTILCFTFLLALPLQARPQGPDGSDPPEGREALAFKATFLTQRAMGLLQQGRSEEALSMVKEALAILEQIHQGRDDANLATCLNNVGYMHQMAQQFQEALPYYRRALAMHRRLNEGEDDLKLALTLNNMGFVLRAMGEHAKARPYALEAVEMFQRVLKGRDHPHLAASLNNLGFSLSALGEDEKALQFVQHALDMTRRGVKGRDHPALAVGLNNVGYMLQRAGELDEALTYYQQALEMERRLFKDADHPNLARGLSNMGAFLRDKGELEQALPYFQQSLDMLRPLNPGRDHPKLAMQLDLLGGLLVAMGQPEKALPHCREALEMRERLTVRFAEAAPLAEALAFTTTFRDSRSQLLSVSRDASGSDRDTLAAVWTTKAALGRLLRRRHQLARLERHDSDAVRNTFEDLRAERSRLVALLVQPASDERDRLVQEHTKKKEELERQLAGLLPKQRDRATPRWADLAAAMGAGQVFVDFYRYRDSGVSGDEKPDRYAAFVLTKAGEPARVELGLAQPIDSAVRAWREGLDAWGSELSPPARRDLEERTRKRTRTLRRLIWEPIARQLPDNAERIYISPDADLARLPFAALPGSEPGTVLLERYAFGVVPSGPFLLERLAEEGGPSMGPAPSWSSAAFGMAGPARTSATPGRSWRARAGSSSRSGACGRGTPGPSA